MKAQVALLALAPLAAVAFWRMPCNNILTVERLDPIVNPGKLSGHVHTVSGGSNFDLSSTYDTLRQSECTSCDVQQDLSAYWTPQLYMQLKNDSFIDVPTGRGNTLVYYLQRRGSDNEKIVAFPPGFRMISGNPMLRSYDPNSLAQQAIDFVCLTYSNPSLKSYYGPKLPSQSCPDGLRAQVVFPSCWNGKDLDAADHKSHMAFPSGVSTGSCPSTHPVRFVTLFYEVTYGVDDLDRSLAKNPDQPFVFAHGDPLGYGFHGDFLNGWDTDVLQTAIDTCTASSGDIEECKVFNLQPQGASCHKTPTANEIVTGQILPKLPGCNPVTFGPANAVPCTDSAPPAVLANVTGYSGDVAPMGSSALDNQPRVVLSGSSYTYRGCFSEVDGRALKQALPVTGDMTVTKCLAACSKAGAALCGLEYGRECWSAATLAAGSQEIALGKCSMPCTGASTQYCGGPSALTLYKIGPVSSASSIASSSVRSSSSARVSASSVSSGAIASSSSKASSSATVSSSGKPSSSSKAPFSPVNSSSRSTKQSSSTKPSSSSSKPSSSTRATASSSKSTSSTKTSSASGGQASLTPLAAFNGYKYRSCWSDKSPRSLLRQLTISGSPTIQKCLTAARLGGYLYAGLEYGGECWVGYSVTAGSALTASQCSMPCKGDATSVCGGPDALTLYKATVMTGLTQVLPSSGPYQYLGCYAEQSSGRALSGASLSGKTMDVNSCVQFCANKNLPYAGVEYGAECYCGSSISTAIAAPISDSAAAGCNMPCANNGTQFCGGAARLSVYYKKSAVKTTAKSSGAAQTKAKKANVILFEL